MASAPSPTPEATRLTLPDRTSPAAKTPGMLVSRRRGLRGRDQPAFRRCSSVRSGPVNTNPLSSSTTQPLNHSAFGLAQVIMNTCRQDHSFDSPVWLLRRTTFSRCRSPLSSTTSVCVCRVMFGVSSIRGIRYQKIGGEERSDKKAHVRVLHDTTHPPKQCCHLSRLSGKWRKWSGGV